MKHRCTLHFVHITLGTLTQFGFLQRPLFSVDVSQCPVSSLLFTGQAQELHLASSSLLQYPTALVTESLYKLFGIKGTFNTERLIYTSQTVCSTFGGILFTPVPLTAVACYPAGPLKFRLSCRSHNVPSPLPKPLHKHRYT